MIKIQGAIETAKESENNLELSFAASTPESEGFLGSVLLTGSSARQLISQCAIFKTGTLIVSSDKKFVATISFSEGYISLTKKALAELSKPYIIQLRPNQKPATDAANIAALKPVIDGKVIFIHIDTPRRDKTGNAKYKDLGIFFHINN